MCGNGIPVNLVPLLGDGDLGSGWMCSSVAISGIQLEGFLPSTSCGTPAEP